MLLRHLASKNIRAQIILPCQWLNVRFNTVRLSHNSSSSDSSDSDSNSDTDSCNKGQQQIRKATSNQINTKANSDNELTEYVNNILNRKPLSNININIKEKNTVSRQRKIQINKQLMDTAGKLTTASEKNKEIILGKMLKNLSKVEKKRDRNSIHKNYPIFESEETMPKNEDEYNNMSIKIKDRKINVNSTNLNDKLKNKEMGQDFKAMNTEKFKDLKYVPPNNAEYNQTENLTITKFKNIGALKKTDHSNEINYRYQKKITSETKQSTEIPEQNTLQRRRGRSNLRFVDSSLSSEKIIREKKYIENDYKRINTGRYNQSFPQFPKFFFTNLSGSTVPALETWNACEERHLKVVQTQYPQNGFQEMIQWTREGKLWKFPIDNEQGMEEEKDVNFSEHIFLERHLANWCPTTGPIRHFMELVCVGLSKNPYMTVQEKYNHIMWYKEYFENKKDLLKKLGLVKVVSPNTKKQIEVN